MKPRVLMVSSPIHPVPPNRGAAVEWWMWQVCRRLVDLEPHIVSIWAPGYAEHEQVEGVTLHRVRIGRVYRRLFQKLTRLDPWGYAARTAQYIRRIDARCVHVHNDPDLFLRLRARAAGPQREFVLHLHNERSNLEGLETARMIVVSDYLRDWYRARLPKAEIMVLTNGVDMAQFGNVPAPSAPLPNIDAQVRRLVLYAGRISPEKGPLRLVQAMGKVIAVAPDVGLVLAGEFARGDFRSERMLYGEAVKSAFNELPVGHAANLGVLPPERMHEVFAHAALVVMPSQFNEPLGMVALEAMAAGVPVLAAHNGGLREIIDAERTGFFLTDTPSDMAARILDVLDLDDATRTRVVAAARAYVAAHHDWPIVAAALTKIYRRVCPTAVLESPPA
ncbi:MAG: glycosyltransferase [Gammaproteobacteria bacterium]|nr:glycosyltransferase [Gammaproteobacteria bacterium]